MTENFRVGFDFPEQPPDIERLIARGRTLRNKIIFKSCCHFLARLRKPFKRI